MLASFGWSGFAAVASAAAALGTLALAVMTRKLARSTTAVATRTGELAHETHMAMLETGRSVDLAEQELGTMMRQVDAAERQAAASQQTLSASTQPLVVPVVERPKRKEGAWIVAGDGLGTDGVQIGSDAMLWEIAGSDLWAVVPVRNVGPGVALFPETGSARIESILNGGMQAEGRPTSRVVAKDDIVDVVFHSRRGEANAGIVAQGTTGSGLQEAVVTLTYRDIAGRETTTRIAYSRSRSTTLSVVEVRFQFID